MSEEHVVKKPELRWLAGVILASQTVIACLMVIFAAIGQQRGWGDVAGSSVTDITFMAVLWVAITVSAFIRYMAVYLLSWSFSHNQRRSEIVYRFGFITNVLFDCFQAYVLIYALAAPVVDGGFALLIIPLGCFWITVGTSVVALLGRLQIRGK